MYLPLTPEKLLHQAKRMDRLHDAMGTASRGFAHDLGPDGYPHRPMQISFTFADAGTVARLAARLMEANSKGEIDLKEMPEAQALIDLAARLLARPLTVEPTDSASHE